MSSNNEPWSDSGEESDNSEYAMSEYSDTDAHTESESDFSDTLSMNRDDMPSYRKDSFASETSHSDASTTISQDNEPEFNHYDFSAQQLLDHIRSKGQQEAESIIFQKHDYCGSAGTMNETRALYTQYLQGQESESNSTEGGQFRQQTVPAQQQTLNQHYVGNTPSGASSTSNVFQGLDDDTEGWEAEALGPGGLGPLGPGGESPPDIDNGGDDGDDGDGGVGFRRDTLFPGDEIQAVSSKTFPTYTATVPGAAQPNVASNGSTDGSMQGGFGVYTAQHDGKELIHSFVGPDGEYYGVLGEPVAPHGSVIYSNSQDKTIDNAGLPHAKLERFTGHAAVQCFRPQRREVPAEAPIPTSDPTYGGAQAVRDRQEAQFRANRETFFTRKEVENGDFATRPADTIGSQDMRRLYSNYNARTLKEGLFTTQENQRLPTPSGDGAAPLGGQAISSHAVAGARGAARNVSSYKTDQITARISNDQSTGLQVASPMSETPSEFSAHGYVRTQASHHRIPIREVVTNEGNTQLVAENARVEVTKNTPGMQGKTQISTSFGDIMVDVMNAVSETAPVTKTQSGELGSRQGVENNANSSSTVREGQVRTDNTSRIQSAPSLDGTSNASNTVREGHVSIDNTSHLQSVPSLDNIPTLPTNATSRVTNQSDQAISRTTADVSTELAHATHGTASKTPLHESGTNALTNTVDVYNANGTTGLANAASSSTMPASNTTASKHIPHGSIADVPDVRSATNSVHTQSSQAQGDMIRSVTELNGLQTPGALNNAVKSVSQVYSELVSKMHGNANDVPEQSKQLQGASTQAATRTDVAFTSPHQTVNAGDQSGHLQGGIVYEQNSARKDQADSGSMVRGLDVESKDSRAQTFFVQGRQVPKSQQVLASVLSQTADVQGGSVYGTNEGFNNTPKVRSSNIPQVLDSENHGNMTAFSASNSTVPLRSEQTHGAPMRSDVSGAYDGGLAPEFNASRTSATGSRLNSLPNRMDGNNVQNTVPYSSETLNGGQTDRPYTSSLQNNGADRSVDIAAVQSSQTHQHQQQTLRSLARAQAQENVESTRNGNYVNEAPVAHSEHVARVYAKGTDGDVSNLSYQSSGTQASRPTSHLTETHSRINPKEYDHGATGTNLSGAQNATPHIPVLSQLRAQTYFGNSKTQGPTQRLKERQGLTSWKKARDPSVARAATIEARVQQDMGAKASLHAKVKPSQRSVPRWISSEDVSRLARITTRDEARANFVDAQMDSQQRVANAWRRNRAYYAQRRREGDNKFKESMMCSDFEDAYTTDEG